MFSIVTVRRFLESLKMDNTEEEEQIINSIITKLSQKHAQGEQTHNGGNSSGNRGSNNKNQSKSEEELRKELEDSLRCKFFGSLLAKIGDRFWEKYSKN